MTTTKTVIYFSAVFIIGLTAGLLIPDHLFRREDNPFTETRSQGSYKFINPLLECDTANFSEDPTLVSLKRNIDFYISNQINLNKVEFVSVYYRNLNNGPWFSINANETFSPSSLIKIPLMITYYKLAESDPSILQKTLSYETIYDYKNQNFIPQITITPQQKYTVEELIERMIIYSDNAAYNLLNDNLDAQTIIKTYEDLGVDISQGISNPSGNIISVKSYASFFRILYNSSYLSKTYSEKSLSLLAQTKFQDGLVAGVPDNISVSHKFGERQYLDTHQKQLHDCGIVYIPNKPYLICIMTRGKNFVDLASTIKNISSMSFKDISSQN